MNEPDSNTRTPYKKFREIHGTERKEVHGTERKNIGAESPKRTSTTGKKQFLNIFSKALDSVQKKSQEEIKGGEQGKE